jgi:acyl phosphate:glycerol-3-phosphate acyltransferase
MEQVMQLGLVVLAYLMGSVQVGILYSRWRGQDIRSQDAPGGSGIYRTYGWGAAILVTLLDMAKGVLVALITLTLESSIGPNIGPSMGSSSILPWTIFAVVMGHNYPLFFGFNGGAGIATGYGALLPSRGGDALSLLLLLIVVAVLYKYTLQKWLKIFTIPFASFISLAIMLAVSYGRGQGFLELLAFTLPMLVRSVQLLLQKPVEVGERG